MISTSYGNGEQIVLLECVTLLRVGIRVAWANDSTGSVRFLILFFVWRFFFLVASSTEPPLLHAFTGPCVTGFGGTMSYSLEVGASFGVGFLNFFHFCIQTSYS